MKEQAVAADAGETRGGGGEEKEDASAGASRRAPGRGGSGYVLIVFSAHRQVDKGKDVKLYHYGEAQEDGVENQHVDPQLPVQPPFVQMDAEDLEGEGVSVGPGGREILQKVLLLENYTRTMNPRTFCKRWARAEGCCR